MSEAINPCADEGTIDYEEIKIELQRAYRQIEYLLSLLPETHRQQYIKNLGELAYAYTKHR